MPTVLQAAKEKAGHSRRLIFHTFSNLGESSFPAACMCQAFSLLLAYQQKEREIQVQLKRPLCSRSGFLGMGGILEILAQRKSPLLSNVCGAVIDSAPQALVRAQQSTCAFFNIAAHLPLQHCGSALTCSTMPYAVVPRIAAFCSTIDVRTTIQVLLQVSLKGYRGLAAWSQSH